MHNFSDWVQVFAGAVSTLVTALAVSHKTNAKITHATAEGLIQQAYDEMQMDK